MMNSDIKVMLFISVGAIVAFLPLIFIKNEKMSVKNILLFMSFFIGLSVAFSVVVSLGGNCSFIDTLLMKKDKCDFLPLANTRTVPVTNLIAFIFFVLLVVAVFRDLFSKLLGKSGDKSL